MTALPERPAAESGRVHIDVDVAERLVALSAEHAAGRISDADFLAQRERLLLGTPDDGGAEGSRSQA